MEKLSMPKSSRETAALVDEFTFFGECAVFADEGK